MGPGRDQHRQPDRTVLGGGGGVLPGGLGGSQVRSLRRLHAVGPMRHVSVPGLADVGCGLLQVQPRGGGQPQGAVHTPLGRPGPKPLQGHLEIQHPGGQVLRGQPQACPHPAILGRGGVNRPHRGAVLQVLRRGGRVSDPGPEHPPSDGQGAGGLSVPVPCPGRKRLARGQGLPGGLQQGGAGHRREPAHPVRQAGRTPGQVRAAGSHRLPPRGISIPRQGEHDVPEVRPRPL